MPPTPRQRLTLFGPGKEWSRAPISGTAILFCYVASVVALLVSNDLHAALLYVLLAEVFGIRRDRYLETATHD